MWIRTQNKQKMINGDQIIDIFIDKTGKKIYAETTRDGDFFELGEYRDRETCEGIIFELEEGLKNMETIFHMPPSDVVFN